MSKAWIKDTWLSKDAPASARRLLNASAGHPERVANRIPDDCRLARYGLGKRWVVCWYETADGRQRERNRSFEKKLDAEKFVTAISDDQYSGRYINESDRNRLFRAAAEEWRAAQHSARASSGKQYDDVLRCYVLPKWGNVPLSRINESDVNEWIVDLRQAKAPYSFRTKKKPTEPAPKYLNQIVNVVFGGVLRYSLRRNWITADPMANIHVSRDDADPEREARRKVFLTYEQVERLADAAGQFDRRDAAMIRFMAYVGTRPGETYALRIGDLDFTRQRVTVSRSLTRDSAGNWTIGPTKTGLVRRVALPGFMADVLKPLCDGRDSSAYVFAARGGVFLRPENWRGRLFNRAVKLAELDGIDGLRPHSLRHTFASLAIAAGCDVRTLASALGHSDVTMTLNKYAGLWPDRLDEVATAMADARSVSVRQG